MKRLLLLSTLFSLLAFTSNAQWLSCIDNGLIGTGSGTCSVIDSVYGCDGLTHLCANDAMYIHGITHYTHDPNPNYSISPCHSDFTISELSGVWSFDDSSSWAGGPNPASSWSFGDGNTDNTYLSTSHSYSSSGYMVVSLTISDAICTSTTSRVILVQGGGGCNALFSASTYCGITTFTDLSSGSGYTAGWDFGDNSTLGNQPPGNQTHSYLTSGTYLVILTIADGTGACNSGFSDSVTVVVPSVSACFSYTTTGSPTDIVTFLNSSTGATSYYWDLGNGDTSSALNPVVDYDSCSYVVQLTAFDDNGCPSEVQEQLINACDVGILSVPSVLNSLSVYPNPAKEDITVVLNSSKASDVVLSMKDVTGREVIEAISIHLHGGENNYKLTLPTLSAGVYLIQVNDELGVMNKSVLVR